MTDLLIYNDRNEYNTAGANFIARAAQDAIAQRGRFTFGLSGGGTPRDIYALLATEPYKTQIDWSKVHVFWSDDRFVPIDDPDSNYQMAYQALLRHVPIPAENIHRMPSDLEDREAAARQHEQELRAFFGDEPRFDLLQQGMGPDGHTASLFPHQASLHEKERWVLYVTVSKPPPPRLTFTFPVINAARQVLFFATGAEKADAVQAVLEGPTNPEEYPSQLVQPTNGTVTWLLDTAAAQKLQHRKRG